MCEVCEDTGTYPVVTVTGKTLYEITCPECGGPDEHDKTDEK